VTPFGYPVSLDVSGRRAVVIGRQAVAAGKAESLLAAGARVTVVAEGPVAALARLEGEGVPVHRRAFHPSDLEDAFVCVASSDDPAERASIHGVGRAWGVLVNVMDDPEHCDFAAPAIVRRGDLAIAISTGGRSPALARRLREELEERFGSEWKEILDVVGDVREETLGQLPDLRERISRWQDALDVGELEQLVKEGRRDEARAALVRRLVGAK
jgi:precorrin-2 dehydrogenase / sirohydrochlorin ferrochelatase